LRFNGVPIETKKELWLTVNVNVEGTK